MNHIHLSSVDSTMTYAKQLVLQGIITSDTLITTDRQTLGKGRWGRTWISPCGNLYMTRVLPHNALYAPFDYSIASALAIQDLANELGCKKVHIKWPNDILINKQKLAGILIERFYAKSDAWISIGIGLNVNSTQEDIQQSESPATSLFLSTGTLFSLDQVRSTLINHQNVWFAQLQNKENLYIAWKHALSWMLTQPLKTHKKQKSIEGIVSDIGKDGSLELLFSDGSKERVLP